MVRCHVNGMDAVFAQQRVQFVHAQPARVDRHRQSARPGERKQPALGGEIIQLSIDGNGSWLKNREL